MNKNEKLKTVFLYFVISTEEQTNKMTKEVKVLSLNNLNRREIDIIEDITSTEVHFWKRNEAGGLDLYYDEYKEFIQE